MAADGDFACIEKAIRKQMYIYSPMDYADIIRNARRRNGRFQVTMMTQADFYDFEQLKARCTIRKPKRIKFSEACYYKIKKDFNGYELAANYGVGERQLALGEKVCWTKGVQRSDRTLNASFNLNVPLKQKYNAPLPLKQAKLLDLKSYVPDLVPSLIYNQYWSAILSANPAPVDSNDDELDEPLDFCANYSH